MQFAGNAALAAALATGQARRFEYVFKVDWARNGLYADPNSDLSVCFSEALIDRQLAGNLPEELEVTEGYAAAQVTIKLEGYAPDGTPVVRLFSPYSGLYPGTVSAVGTPCYLDVIVITSSGPVTIRQFTGVVHHGAPLRTDGAVTLVLRDYSDSLAVPINLPAWAADGRLRRGNFSADQADSGTILLSWLIDYVMRLGGFRQGPAWHPNALIGWTLSGSGLPEVGHFSITDAHVPLREDIYDLTYYDWQIPNVTPAGAVADVWRDSPSGVAVTGIYLPNWFLSTEVAVRGNAHAASLCGPLTYGSNNSNLLGFSWQAEVDTGQTSIFMSPSEIRLHLEDVRYDPTGDYYTSYAYMRLTHGSGDVRLVFVEHGWVKTWQWAATINPVPTRWVNVYGVLRFASTGITPYLFVNGVSVALSVVSNPAWPPVAMAFGIPTTSTNHGRIEAFGPVNNAQIFYQHNTLIGDLIAPDYGLGNAASVSVSALRLNSIPKRRWDSAWSLLRELATADLGALYITEYGVVTFDSRADILARQTTATSDMTLTLDQVSDLGPSADITSVINHLSWQLTVREAEITYNGSGVASVFATSNPWELAVPAGTTYADVIQYLSDDIEQVRIGGVSYEPRAMGYLAGGGANPDWAEWMQYYTPGFFGDGYAPYVPGSRASPSVQPVPAASVTALVELGYIDGDTDPSRIRLTLANASAFDAYYAVDDRTPFLHVAGVRVITKSRIPRDLFHIPSVVRYGYRTATLEGGVWLQDELTVTPLAQGLINYTAKPHPAFQALELPGDPRRQLQDTVRIEDPVLGGPIFASVVGIRRRLAKREGITDNLTLRTYGPSGPAWIMGDPDFSIMGRTTYVTT
jgi:hypothetical protein